MFLGASISLEKDDIDGSTFMYEAIDDLRRNARRQLQSEHVWVVVASHAACDHWAPTLPPLYESEERALESDMLLEELDYESTDDEGEGEGEDAAAREGHDGMAMSTDGESEAERSERGSSTDSDDSEMDVQISEIGRAHV